MTRNANPSRRSTRWVTVVTPLAFVADIAAFGTRDTNVQAWTMIGLILVSVISIVVVMRDGPLPAPTPNAAGLPGMRPIHRGMLAGGVVLVVGLAVAWALEDRPTALSWGRCTRSSSP